MFLPTTKENLESTNTLLKYTDERKVHTYSL